MIKFICSNCEADLKAPVSKAGAVTACPRCKQKLTIPSPSAARPAKDDRQSDTNGDRRSDSHRSQRDVDDRRGKGITRSRMPKRAWMVVAGIAAIVIVIGGVLGIRAMRTDRPAKTDIVSANTPEQSPPRTESPTKVAKKTEKKQPGEDSKKNVPPKKVDDDKLPPDEPTKKEPDLQPIKGKATLDYWNRMREVASREEPAFFDAARASLLGNHAPMAKLIKDRIAELEAVAGEGVDEDAILSWKKHIMLKNAVILLLKRADQALQNGEAQVLAQIHDEIANAPRVNSIDREQERVRRLLCKRYKLDFRPLLPDIDKEQLDEDRLIPIPIKVHSSLGSVVVKDVELDEMIGFRRIQSQFAGLSNYPSRSLFQVLPALFLTSEQPRTVFKARYTSRSSPLVRDGLLCTFRNTHDAIIGVVVATNHAIAQGATAEIVATCLSDEKIGSVDITAASSAEIRRLQGHSGRISSLCFSNDGRLVVSACDDRTVRVWDIATGKERHRLSHDTTINCIALSPDRRIIVAGTGKVEAGPRNVKSDTTVRVWDLVGERELPKFTGHRAPVHCAAFSDDGKYVLSASGYVLREADTREIWGFRYTPMDCVARLWELSNGKEIQRFDGHSDAITTVSLSPDGRHALTGSDDKTVRLWDIRAGREVRRFRQSVGPPEVGAIKLARFSDSGRKVVAVSCAVETPHSHQRRIWTWDVANETNGQVDKGQSTSATSGFAFSSDGRRILVFDGYEKVSFLYLFESNSATEIHRERVGDNVQCVAFSPDGRFAALGINDGSIRIRVLPSK